VRLTLRAARAVMGKAEGLGENWHGHVTAVTVREARAAPLARRLIQRSRAPRLPGGAGVPAAEPGTEADGPAGGDDHQAARGCCVPHALAPQPSLAPDARSARRRHDGYFVDLFVRKSNAVAIGMYEKARAACRAAACVLRLGAAACVTGC
jgi:hypothetical protein